jgi:hypothetical protein
MDNSSQPLSWMGSISGDKQEILDRSLAFKFAEKPANFCRNPQITKKISGLGLFFGGIHLSLCCSLT